MICMTSFSGRRSSRYKCLMVSLKDSHASAGTCSRDGRLPMADFGVGATLGAMLGARAWPYKPVRLKSFLEVTRNKKNKKNERKKKPTGNDVGGGGPKGVCIPLGVPGIRLGAGVGAGLKVDVAGLNGVGAGLKAAGGGLKAFEFGGGLNVFAFGGGLKAFVGEL